MTGMEVLELITYHCLGIGFIASGMRNSKKKFTKKRAGEIFDSGVTTVNGYLIQAFAGLIITLVAVWGIGTDGMISAPSPRSASSWRASAASFTSTICAARG